MDNVDDISKNELTGWSGFIVSLDSRVLGATINVCTLVIHSATFDSQSTDTSQSAALPLTLTIHFAGTKLCLKKGFVIQNQYPAENLL
jgi:hypothetical protein